MTEKFVFEQSLRKERRNSWLRKACPHATVGMKRASHQFLAGAALASNQHRGVSGGGPRDKPVYLAHTRALTDHIVLDIKVLLQTEVFTLQPFHPARSIKGGSRDTSNGRQ